MPPLVFLTVSTYPSPPGAAGEKLDTAAYLNLSSQFSARPAEVKLSCSGKTELVGALTNMTASATARSWPSEGEFTTPSPLIHIVVEPPPSSARASVAPTVVRRNAARSFQPMPML